MAPYLKRERALFDSCDLKPQADEIWSFVVSKENRQWVWIALDIATRQVLDFYVGDRSASSAQELWRRMPQVYRDHETFYTDGLAAYKTVLLVISANVNTDFAHRL